MFTLLEDIFLFTIFDIVCRQLYFCLLNIMQSVFFFSGFFFFLAIIEIPFSPMGIKFRAGVCKDTNSPSYLCFDICLLLDVDSLFLRFLCFVIFKQISGPES